MKNQSIRPFVGFLLCMALISCSHIYYKSWEVLGKEKRDLLVSNVTELKDDQSDAKEEMQNALERIRSEYNFKSGTLAKTYDKMSDDYSGIESEVIDVKKQLKKVESIAEDLFEEWKKEAHEFKNKSYRNDSLKSLSKTKKRFNKLVKSAKSTEKNMDKTLMKFKDQVIYLKHNLNAKMVGHLSIEIGKLEIEMEVLIGKIEDSINESSQFLNQMR